MARILLHESRFFSCSPPTFFDFSEGVEAKRKESDFFYSLVVNISDLLQQELSEKGKSSHAFYRVCVASFSWVSVSVTERCAIPIKDGAGWLHFIGSTGM